MNESRFKDLLTENIVNQWAKFLYYRTLCKKRGRNIDDLKNAIRNEEYYRIPGVVAAAFKKSRGLVGELNDLSMTGRFQVSSSTSGDPSYVYTCDDQLARIRSNYARGFDKKEISAIVAFSPSRGIMKGLSKRAGYLGKDAVIRMKLAVDAAESCAGRLHYTVTLNVPKSCFTMLVKGKPAFSRMSAEDLTSIIKAVEKRNQRVGLGGIALLFEPYLSQLKDGSFNLHGNAVILFSGGGYSGLKGSIVGKPIDKPAFIEKIAAVFGVEEKFWSTNITDIYGFTESSEVHEGHWDADLGDFLFEVSPDSKVYIVDPVTEMPLKQGRGLLKTISLYESGDPSAANVSVIQMDSAETFGIKDGFQVARFSRVSRVAGASIEGCAYKAAEIAQV
jgi:hypothetical protein